MGSSWAGSMAVKSSSVKFIGGNLGKSLMVTEWTDWIVWRCFYQGELEHPPPANPPTIVFICPAMCLGLMLSREGLLHDFPSFRLMLSSGIVPDMVLMTFQTLCCDWSFLRGLSLCDRFQCTKRRDLSCPRHIYCFFRSLGEYLSLCGDRYELVFIWTNLHRWTTLINSSILSFNA